MIIVPGGRRSAPRGRTCELTESRMWQIPPHAPSAERVAKGTPTYWQFWLRLSALAGPSASARKTIPARYGETSQLVACGRYATRSEPTLARAAGAAPSAGE